MQTSNTNNTTDNNQNSTLQNIPNASNSTNSSSSSRMTDKGNQISRNNQNDSQRGWKFGYKLTLETLGLIAALLITFFTYRTFTEIKTQTITTVKTNQITQRAYLKIGDVKEMWVQNYQFDKAKMIRELKIPLINFGHVPCRKIIVSLGCFVAGKEKYIISQKPDFAQTDCVISPNEIDQFFVWAILPEYSSPITQELNKGKLTKTVSGKIVYNTGFNSFDTLQVCLSHNPFTDKWEQCSRGGLEIELHNKEE